MKWFDRWFAKKCKQVWEENSPSEIESGYINQLKKPARLSRDHDTTLNSRGTQFTLYSANGGTVVELRDYDPMNDRLQNILYVISSDKDLGQELGHIVTMEALKR